MTDYLPQSSDVSEAADRALFEALRRLTPLQRLQMAVRGTQMVHRLSVAGLRLRFPNAAEDELHRRAGALRVGPDLMRRVFGDAAEAWLS